MAALLLGTVACQLMFLLLAPLFRTKHQLDPSPISVDKTSTFIFSNQINSLREKNHFVGTLAGSS
jgi:hypothetical protein